MKHKIIKPISCLIMLLYILSLTGCQRREMEYGDFKYIMFEAKLKTYVEITGLSEAGRQKAVLVIPEEINGVKVTAISDRRYIIGNSPIEFSSKNLEKLYLIENINVQSLSVKDCPLLKSAFVINTKVDDILGNNGIADVKDMNIYIFSVIFFKKGENQWGENIFPANVTYYYNFERADNYGCFWLDNIEQGEKITHLPPTNPIRERYEFGGWYKEPECINKWDFETDVMPNYDSKEFYELKLYAKWN